MGSPFEYRCIEDIEVRDNEINRLKSLLDRWQLAVGMPLEQAEELAKSIKYTHKEMFNLDPYKTNIEKYGV